MLFGNMISYGFINVFSFIFSCGVKVVIEVELCNDDGNFDKDSKVSFEINWVVVN